MTNRIKNPYDRPVKLDDFQNRSVRNTVQTAGELCDRVMDYVLSARQEWLPEQINSINQWLDKKPQTIAGLLKKKPEEILGLSEEFNKRRPG